MKDVWMDVIEKLLVAPIGIVIKSGWVRFLVGG